MSHRSPTLALKSGCAYQSQGWRGGCLPKSCLVELGFRMTENLSGESFVGLGMLLLKISNIHFLPSPHFPPLPRAKPESTLKLLPLQITSRI